MSAIELIGVGKAWGDSVAVDDVSFAVEKGSFVVLLGPSGCGKSTTLRMIAGLEDVSAGQILIDGEDVTSAPPSQRRLSMVFQSYALFPHLNVEENIVFGLKVRKVDPNTRRQRLREVAELVGLESLLDRKPSQLSGGQRQRVALARAIIAENPICLMDEPLSNLDAKLRHDMRVEIRALQLRLGMTVVYVTHDQTEAMSMADKVILIRDGRIEQEGTPEALYNAPATTFAANFIGTPPMNLLRLATSEAGLRIAGADSGPDVVERNDVVPTLGIRPEHISLSSTGGVAARLTSFDYLGADTIVAASIGEQAILIRTPGKYAPPDDGSIRLCWSADDARVFDTTTGSRLAEAKPLSVTK